MKQAMYETLRVALVDCATPRVLFLKHHQPAVGDGVAQDSALFVAGIPFKLREGLQQLFSQFGAVQKVLKSTFHPNTTPHMHNDISIQRCENQMQVQLHPRQTSAVVLFSSAQGVKRALAVARKGQVISTDDDASEQSVGLRAYVDEHKSKFPGNQKLKEELDAWMEASEAEEECKRIAAQQSAADDGWTVVTRKAGRKRKQGVLPLIILLKDLCKIMCYL